MFSRRRLAAIEGHVLNLRRKNFARALGRELDARDNLRGDKGAVCPGVGASGPVLPDPRGNGEGAGRNLACR